MRSSMCLALLLLGLLAGCGQNEKAATGNEGVPANKTTNGSTEASPSDHARGLEEPEDLTPGLDYSPLEQLAEIYTKPQSEIEQISVSSDSKSVAYLVEPGTLVVHEICAGHEVLRFAGFGIGVFALGPDGQIAASTKDGVRVWSAFGKDLALFPNLKSIHRLLFCQDGVLIALGSDDPTILRLDTKTGKKLNSFAIGKGAWHGMAVSADSKRIAVASWQALKEFNLSDGSELFSVDVTLGREGEPCVDFSPSGKRLACALGVLDATSGRSLLKFEATQSCVRYSPDGHSIASRDESGDHIRFWEAATLKQSTRKKQSRSAYQKSQFVFSPDGKYIASGGTSLVLLGFRRAPKPIEGHTGKITCLDFSLDGKRLVTASEDKTGRVWDVATGTTKTTLKAVKPFSAIRFRPDGSSVLTSDMEGAVKLWDASTGALMRSYRESGQPVTSLDISPDGKLFATAEGDGTIRIWDVAGGTNTQSLPLYMPTSVQFSQDGTMLAASTWGYILVWNVADWTEKFRFDILTRSFVFSRDNQTLAAIEATEGRLNRWELKHGEELARPDDLPQVRGCIACSEKGLALPGEAVAFSYLSTGATWTRMATPKFISQVYLSPDGLTLAGILDFKVCLWSVEPDPDTACVFIEHPDLVAARVAKEALYKDGGFRGTAFLRATGSHLFFFTLEKDGSFVLNAVPHGQITATEIARAPEGRSWSRVVQAAAGDRFLYFIVQEGKQHELYRSDGTAEGTIHVTSMQGELSEDSNNYVVFDGKLFCSGGTATKSGELFCSNGTVAGSGVIKELYHSEYRQGEGESNPHGFFVYGGKLMFFAAPQDQALSLYTTDGTDKGTQELGRCGNGHDLVAWPLVTMNGCQYFGVRSRPDGGDPQCELWKSSGGAPTLVRGGFRGWESLRSASVLKGKLYFRAATSKQGDVFYERLWVSDGQDIGTQQVNQFVDDDSFLEISGVTTIGEEVIVCTVHRQKSGEDARNALWAYNPANRTGREVAEFRGFYLDEKATSLYGRLDFEVVGGKAWFPGTQAKVGGTLLFTDGKRIGSLGDSDPKSAGHKVADLQRYGDLFAYFSVYSQHVEVWLADPAEGTLKQVKRK